MARCTATTYNPLRMIPTGSLASSRPASATAQEEAATLGGPDDGL